MVLLEIPYLQQLEAHTCSEAVLSMAALAQGIALSREQLLRALASTEEEGTANDHFAEVAARFFDLQVQHPGTLSVIRAAITSGYPVVVNFLVPFANAIDERHYRPIQDGDEVHGHFALVVGFDTKHLILHDPSFDGLRAAQHRNEVYFDYQAFEPRWKARWSGENRWMMVLKQLRGTSQIANSVR